MAGPLVVCQVIAMIHEQKPTAVARIVHYAEEVFGDHDFAEKWLTRPNPDLHDRVPMDVARTEIGARRVEAILSRFEHGDDH
jgi:putative toxin-antitoxin system antitoxin component (TIGR02293 family)